MTPPAPCKLAALLTLAVALLSNSATAQVSSVLDIQRTGAADGSAIATWNSATGTVNAVGAAWDTAPVFPGGAGTVNSARINASAAGSNGEINLILDGGFSPSLSTLWLTEGGGNGDLRISSSAPGLSTILMQDESIIQYTTGGRTLDIDTSIDFGAANVGADTVRILNNTDSQQLNIGGNGGNGATAGNTITQGADDILQLAGRGAVAFDHGLLDGTAVLSGTVESNLGREQANVLPWIGADLLRFRAESTENDAAIEIQTLTINTPSSMPVGWTSDIAINPQVTGAQAGLRIERAGNGTAQLDVGTFNLNTDLLNFRGTEGGRNSRMIVRDDLNLDANSTGEATLRFFGHSEFQSTAPLDENITLNLTGNGVFRAAATNSTGVGTINLTNGATIFQATAGGLGSGGYVVDVGKGSAFRINPNMTGNAASISTTIIRDGGYFGLENANNPLATTDFDVVGSGARIQIAEGAIIDERTLLNATGGAVGTTQLPSLAGDLFLGLRFANTTENINLAGSETNQLFRGIGIGNSGGTNFRGTYSSGGGVGDLDFRITGMPNNAETSIFRGEQLASGVVSTDEPILNPESGIVNFEITRETGLQFRTVAQDLTASGGTLSTQGLGGSWTELNINGSDSDNDGLVDIEYAHETILQIRRSPRVAPNAGNGTPELLDYSGGVLVGAMQTVNVNAGIRLVEVNVNRSVSTANMIQGTVNINENAVLWLNEADADLDSYKSGVFNLNEGSILRVNSNDRMGGGATFNSSPGARLLTDADLNFNTLLGKNAGTQIEDFTIDLSTGADDNFTGINLGNGQGINGRLGGNSDINTANAGTGLNVITSSAASINLRAPILHTETNDLTSGNPWLRQLRIDGNLETPNTDIHINVEGAGPQATGIATSGYVFISGGDRADLEYSDAASIVILNGLSTAQNMTVHNGVLRVGAQVGEGPGGANAELSLSGDLTLQANGIGPNDQQEFLSGTVTVGGVIDVNPSGQEGLRYVSGSITTSNAQFGRLVIDTNDGAADQGLIDGLANDTMAQGTDGIRLNNRSSLQILYTATAGPGSPGTLFNIDQTITSNMQNGQFNNIDNGLLQINETSATLGTVNFNDIQVNADRSFRINENGGAVARANITARGDIEMSVNGLGDDFDLLGVQSDIGGTARNVRLSGSTFGATDTFVSTLLGTASSDVTLELINRTQLTVDAGNLGLINGNVIVRDDVQNELIINGGTTTIQASQFLLVQGSGTVSAAAGGNLVINGRVSGNGTVSADTTIALNGIIDPGDGAVDTLNITGDLSIVDDNVFNLEITSDPGIGPGTPGTDYDTVAGVTNFTYPGGDDAAEIMTINLGGLTSFDPNGAVFDLIQFTTNLGGSGIVGSVLNGGLVINGAPLGWDVSGATIQVDTESLFLTGIIPEPAPTLLVFLGASLFLRRRRQR